MTNLLKKNQFLSGIKKKIVISILPYLSNKTKPKAHGDCLHRQFGLEKQKHKKLVTFSHHPYSTKPNFCRIIKTNHSYHLVDPSPWPLFASFSACMLTCGTVLYMHKFTGGWDLLATGFCGILFVMFVWWRDIIREATYEDTHTITVQKGLRLGMILFIASEVMFFFAFFWAFFHSSISPVHNIGGVWPPKAISLINPYTIPLTNTCFLLTSGVTITWAHHALRARAKKHVLVSLVFTLILAILFTCLQAYEYVNAPFNISDGIYGSCFYLTTGFHGFHVFIGTIAILVSFIRVILNHFTNTHHFGFEAAIWYWHFVDSAGTKHVIYRF